MLFLLPRPVPFHLSVLLLGTSIAVGANTGWTGYLFKRLRPKKAGIVQRFAAALSALTPLECNEHAEQ